MSAWKITYTDTDREPETITADWIDVNGPLLQFWIRSSQNQRERLALAVSPYGVKEIRMVEPVEPVLVVTEVLDSDGMPWIDAS